MSRHRNIRNIATEEDLSDEELPSSYDESGFSGSPSSASPATRTYMFDRNRSNQLNVGLFLKNQHEKKSQALKKEEEDDSALINSNLPRVLEVARSATTQDAIEALRENNYDVDKAIQALLPEVELDQSPTKEKDKEKEDLFEMEMDAGGDSLKQGTPTIQNPTINTSASSLSIRFQPISRSFRPAHSSAHISSVSIPTPSSRPITTSFRPPHSSSRIFSPSTTSSSIAPVTEPSISVSSKSTSISTNESLSSQTIQLPSKLQSPSKVIPSHLPINNNIIQRSAFAEAFCSNSNDILIPSSISSLSPTLMASSDIIQFAFDTPSPDDVVMDARNQGFNRKKDVKVVEPVKIDLSDKGPVVSTITVTPIKKDKTEEIVIGPMSSMSISEQQIVEGDISSKPMKTSTDALKKDGRAELKSSLERIKLTKQMTASRRREIETKISQNANAKPHLNMVVIGHVDAGKSTLMGHMLYLLGNVSQRTMHKYEKESKDKGKGSFSYAWVLDEHEEERNRGITMDVAVNNFETDHRRITLLDAPGHRDFVPNMISGTAQADVALLVIDAIDFEKGFDSDGQTKEHALLARSLGVTQLGVAVNKLDLAGWSKERFDQIGSKLGAFLKQSGFQPKNVWFIPTSGLLGENLTSKKDAKLLSWYDGPTLIQRIDEFQPTAREFSKPFRLCISDVYKSQILGLTVAGKVESGLLSVGDKLALVPLYEVCTVKGIRLHNEAVEYAMAGDNVDIGITGIEIQNIGLGNFLCDPEQPIPLIQRFKAQIITFTLQRPILKGTTAELHYQILNEPAVVSKLVAILDKSTGELKKKNPRALPDSTTALVEIKTQHPVCLELYTNIKQLGRFTLREGGRTIAAGIVSDLS